MLFVMVAWMKFKNSVLKYYFIFLLLFTVYLVINLVRIYITEILNEKEIWINIFSFSVYFIWYPFFLYFVPYFFHKLTEVDYSAAKKAAFAVLGISYPLMLITAFLIGKNPENIYSIMRFEMRTTGGILILFIIAYITIFMIRSYIRLENEMVKKILKIFALITIVFIPGFILDSKIDYFQYQIKIFPVGFFFSVIYYLVLNVISIFLLARYFLLKINLLENKLITDKFISKFSITVREKEIMLLLMEGCTYDQISAKLFIAVSTVKSHIHNVYQKTGSKTKTQFKQIISGEF